MKSFFPILILFLLFSACNKETTNSPSGAWSNSVFIVNEGPFPAGSGTISAFNRETKEVTNDLFEAANGRPLGNVVQSITVFWDRAFIVVNNSNVVEVVNLEDFKSIGTIENLTLPRYFVGMNKEKGYVSCWDGTVKVINLVDYSIIKTITAGSGPDKMLLSGSSLWVINGGGFGTDSTVTVIDALADSVLKTIEVGHRPVGIQYDDGYGIWILCAGKGYNGWPAPGDTPGKLVHIHNSTMAVVKEFIFPDTENHPDNLIINKKRNTLFYNYPKEIFSLSTDASVLNEQTDITVNETIYGMGYDNDLSMIYVTYPLDYVQNGWVFRFRVQDGAVVDSLQVGIIPNGFWFN